jgi:hypothetical protein
VASRGAGARASRDTTAGGRESASIRPRSSEGSPLADDHDKLLAAEPPSARQEGGLAAVVEELARLRKAVLRQGHAQELFQARVEEAVAGLAAGAAEPASPQPPAGPTTAQVRALMELDQAVLQLLRLAEAGAGDRPGAVPVGAAADADDDAPRSLREGLALLQVRVRNLQHALGLEPIPARGCVFDDRWHEAGGVAERPDLPDRWVVEEILPGYRLGGRVVRPARVIVNRRGERAAARELTP